MESTVQANILDGIVDEGTSTLRQVDSNSQLDRLAQESSQVASLQETTITVDLQEVTVSSAGEQYNETSSFIPQETTVAFRTTTVKSTLSDNALKVESDQFDSQNGTGICFGSHLNNESSKTATSANDPDPESVREISTTLVEIRIGPQHFELLKLLGTGAFGKVVLVQNRLNRKLYAMKVISKHLIKKKNNIQYMKSERDILTKVQHPFLVSLQFAFQSDTKLFLVMDFLSGGELFLHLRRRGLIMENEVQFYLGEMVLAVEFLHQRGIIHRDLKPENVLLRSDAHICITDFGLAKEIGNDINVRTLCGTSEYMAPEMLTRTGYGKAVDWWALGALCYEMLVGKPPFTSKTNNQKELDKKIIFEKLSVPSYLTGKAVSLLRGMLDKDPTKRLGCAKSTMFNIGGITMLKQHEFFQGLDWIALGNLELTPPINLNDSSTSQSSNHRSQQQEDVTNNLKFFSEEFTTQTLSPSLLEDTYSTHTPSPLTRSRVVSGRNSPSLFDEDPFRDFEYTDTRFQCTANQLEEYQQMMANKQQKLLKKKSLKLKKEQKQQEEVAERKLREAHEEQLRLVRLEQERQRLAQEALEKQRKEELQRQLRLKQQQEQQRLAHNARVQQYLDELTALQKRIKNTRKKLREIQELREKLTAQQAEVNKDQKQKLAKEKEVDAELQSLLVSEQELMKTCPGEIIPPPPTEQDPTVQESALTSSSDAKEVTSSSGGSNDSHSNSNEVVKNNTSNAAATIASHPIKKAETAAANAWSKPSSSIIGSNNTPSNKPGASVTTDSKTNAAPTPSSSITTAKESNQGSKQVEDEWATASSKKSRKPRGK